MTKALLVNLPRYDTVAPPSAIGILAGICEANNVDYDICDFSVIIKEHFSNEDFLSIDNWLTFVNNNIEQKLKNQLIGLWQTHVVSRLPNYELAAISVFTYWSLPIAKLLFEYQITQDIGNCKVVVGGNGVQSRFPDTQQSFEDWAKQNNIADYVIFGEAETPFDSILKGITTGPGINNQNFVQEDNLDSFPFPSYKKFQMSKYSRNRLYITGSRGCVRKCTFCDIQNMWPKFRYRSAENIIQEIKNNYYETGITQYDFTDSLINGSVSNFYRFNSLLAEEKSRNNDLKDVSYIGQAIVRPRHQMPEHHYEAMYYAGCEQVTIGIESFSESVRNHMLKKFSNQDIDYHAKQCSYWGIKNIWLMITGYPTETLKDHQDNLNGLKHYQKYAKQGIIEMIRWGTTMHLIEDTPITDPAMLKSLEIEQNHNYNKMISDWHYNWVSKKNPSLDLRERLRRRLEIHFESVKLGYPQPRVIEELEIINALAEYI